MKNLYATTPATITTTQSVPENVLDLVDASQVDSIVQTMLDNDNYLNQNAGRPKVLASLAALQADNGGEGEQRIIYPVSGPNQVGPMLFLWSSQLTSNAQCISYAAGTSGGYWVPSFAAIMGLSGVFAKGLATLQSNRVVQPPVTPYIKNIYYGYTNADSSSGPPIQLLSRGVQNVAGDLIEVSFSIQCHLSAVPTGVSFPYIEILENTNYKFEVVGSLSRYQSISSTIIFEATDDNVTIGLVGHPRISGAFTVTSQYIIKVIGKAL